MTSSQAAQGLSQLGWPSARSFWRRRPCCRLAMRVRGEVSKLLRLILSGLLHDKSPVLHIHEVFSRDHTHHYSKITSWVLFLILNRKRSPPGSSHTSESQKKIPHTYPAQAKSKDCPRTDLLLFFFSALWCSLPTFQEKLLLPNGNFISTYERT